MVGIRSKRRETHNIYGSINLVILCHVHLHNCQPAVLDLIQFLEQKVVVLENSWEIYISPVGMSARGNYVNNFVILQEFPAQLEANTLTGSGDEDTSRSNHFSVK